MADKVKSEPDRFAVTGTAGAMLGIMAFVAVCAGAIWLAYPSVRQEEAPAPAVFPAPRLELAPRADHQSYLARQQALLAGADGRLPIEDAMTAVVRRGTLEAPGVDP